jgi:uncharacterized oxidoreductase
MKLTGNPIFITGGGSGIGKALAEALHARGNQVIIAGRRASRLQDTIDANPGMKSVELDITSPENIAAVTKQLISDFPDLNVVMNNAGIMEFDDLAGAIDDDHLVRTVTTNLMGPIRLTGALVEHLKTKPDATIINVSSVLGFVPLAITGVYSATKAAMHSYTLSLRWRLKGSSVKVLELAPPWVQTELLNSSEEARAMPLVPFIEETLAVLATDAEEILVERAVPIRANPGPAEHGFVDQFNDAMVEA